MSTSFAKPEWSEDKTSPRTTHLRDKGLIHPTPHYVRRGWVCQGKRSPPAQAEQANNIRYPTEIAEGAIPDGGARSATLERMTAVSRGGAVRERNSSRTTTGGDTEVDTYKLAV